MSANWRERRFFSPPSIGEAVCVPANVARRVSAANGCAAQWVACRLAVGAHLFGGGICANRDSLLATCDCFERPGSAMQAAPSPVLDDVLVEVLALKPQRGSRGSAAAVGRFPLTVLGSRSPDSARQVGVGLLHISHFLVVFLAAATEPELADRVKLSTHAVAPCIEGALGAACSSSRGRASAARGPTPRLRGSLDT